MEAVAPGLASERMEIEAGDVQVPQCRRVFERIQPAKRPRPKVRRHFRALPGPKQPLKLFVAEAPYHGKSVTS